MNNIEQQINFAANEILGRTQNYWQGWYGCNIKYSLGTWEEKKQVLYKNCGRVKVVKYRENTNLLTSSVVSEMWGGYKIIGRDGV